MLVALCFFLSGAAALVLQVLWTRMLGHVFGATALAVSTTLTAFMMGLALGAFIGGRWAPKLKRPLLVFAVLETAVGLYGLLVPSLLGQMPAVQRFIGIELGIGFIGYSLLRFVIVTAILILPTTAMGATLPVLAEGVVKRGPEIASRVGRLYAANTFGAVVGAVVAGFVLIPDLGIEVTVRLAAGIDLFVALLVLLLYKLGGGSRILLYEREKRSADDILLELEPIRPEDVTPAAARVSLVAFMVSGASAMMLEVLWTRAVGVVIGASTYAFTLILGTFLVGLASGAYAMSKQIDRLRHPVLTLAYVQLAVGIFAAFGSVLVDQLPHWLHSAAIAKEASFGSIYVRSFFLSSAVMLPATLALGAVMPLVVRILSPEGREHAGAIVARAYTVNTVGAILGSFLAGFFILPLIGVERGLKLAALLSISVAIMLAIVRSPRPKGLMAAACVAGAVIFALPSWNVGTWTAGMFRYYLARSVYKRGFEFSGKVAYHRDGLASTVTVETDDEGTGYSLKVNGKVDASDAGDMPTQVLSGLLPVLVAPESEDVLVIGYGSGVTSGSVLRSAQVKKLVLVELEEAVYEAANRFFSHVNRKPPSDPRFRAVIDDGRNYLLAREDRFDIIISEPSNPWMTGAASLFTEDFFRIIQKRLAPGGVYLQWLQLYELSPRSIRTLYRTVTAVFPHVVVFSPSPRSNDTLVLAAESPIALRRAVLERLFEDPKLRTELQRADVHVPEDFFGLFIAGEEEAKRLAGAGPLNTDDNAFIEFAAPRELLEFSEKDAELPEIEEMEGARLSRSQRHFTGFDFEDPVFLAKTAYRLTRQGRLKDAEAFESRSRARLDAAELQEAVRAAVLDQLDLTAWLRTRLAEDDVESVVIANEETKKDAVYKRAVATMVDGDETQALRVVDQPKDFEKRSPAHRLLYAYLTYMKGRRYDAEHLIEGVLEDEVFSAENPVAYYYAARIQQDLGRYARAVDLLEDFRRARDDLAAGP
jgi:spermidine synthase